MARSATTLQPVILRRTKEDLLSDELPQPSIRRQAVNMTPEQFSMYRHLIDESRKTRNQQDGTDRISMLAVLQKLIMLCSHPRLLSKNIYSASIRDLINESPKLADTVRLLNEIKKKDEKVLIFTKYHDMQAILRRVILEMYGVIAPVINGTIPSGRQGIVDEFNRHRGFHVMILSPRAAGLGLNITSANHVIHYTREWNPAIENQATDRVHRIGQKKPVTVYYPIMLLPGAKPGEENQGITVEQRLDMLLDDKRKLMKSIIVPSGLEIKADDFADLI